MVINGTEVKKTSLPLPTTIFTSSSLFYTNHITLLVQKWKLHIQRISWKGQDMSKKILVHVVKDNETLSYISRLYGVPIPEIAAANKDIVRDADQVFEGQHLSIPSAVVGCAQLFHSGKDTEHQSRKATSSLGFNIREWNQILTLPLSSLSPIAKTTGSFLVLLLLVAFCISCILGALQSRVERNMRHQHRSNSKRWRAVLSDLTDPNALDAESGPDSEPFLEDHENLHFEDADHAYSKLENDYQKFLSECGMSNWGHFRGGSPD